MKPEWANRDIDHQMKIVGMAYNMLKDNGYFAVDENGQGAILPETETELQKAMETLSEALFYALNAWPE